MRSSETSWKNVFRPIGSWSKTGIAFIGFKEFGWDGRRGRLGRNIPAQPPAQDSSGAGDGGDLGNLDARTLQPCSSMNFIGWLFARSKKFVQTPEELQANLKTWMTGYNERRSRRRNCVQRRLHWTPCLSGRILPFTMKYLLDLKNLQRQIIHLRIKNPNSLPNNFKSCFSQLPSKLKETIQVLFDLGNWNLPILNAQIKSGPIRNG